MSGKILSCIKLFVYSFIVFFLTACTANNLSGLVIKGDEQFSMAPHGKGNVYAPDIVQHNNKYYLYYGAQAKDGHDRIQLAVSTDAKNWRKKGVVFFVQGANHVNDPSVVVVNNTFYMYYTLAMHGVTDSIGLAVSKDGIRWKNKGVVLKPSKPPKWDSLLVGRPSVLYEKGLFRMWYDGRKDLPLGSPDAKAPKSAKSHRDVGYAESKNGVKWKKRVKFVFGRDAGGIHVSKLDDGYAMLFESRKGTQWATSLDGIKWNYKGVLLQNEMQTAPYGHVTPFLLHEKGGLSLYYGAARANSWDNNFIMMKSLVTESLQ